MWLVMTNRLINMNNISSVEMEHTGETEVEKRWQVILRFVRNESDQPLFQGSSEKCEIFMEHFEQHIMSYPVFHLEAVEAAVEAVGDDSSDEW